jgi:hypothetical protein
VKETQSQFKLPGVPQAKQGREVPQKWDWTEASVWTERMLATLEGGIKGGQGFSLIDKSRTSLPSPAMDSDRDAGPKTRCGE